MRIGPDYEQHHKNSVIAALVENGYYATTDTVVVQDENDAYAAAFDLDTGTRLDSINIYKFAMTEDELIDYILSDESATLEAIKETKQTVLDLGASDLIFYVAAKQIDSEKWIVIIDGAIFY